MPIKKLIAAFALLTAVLPTVALAATDLQHQTSVELIQPLNSGASTVPVSGSTIAFVQYFNDSLLWVQVVCVGLALIWLVVGGIMIMIGMQEQGKEHVQWALIGLAVLAFVGSVLKALNSIFFV